MKPEPFIKLCESIYDGDSTGSAGSSKVYFRSIYIGYEYPNIGPPSDDDLAADGYKFGLELRERLKYE